MMTFIANTQKEGQSICRNLKKTFYFIISTSQQKVLKKHFIRKMNEKSFLCVFKLTLYSYYNKKNNERIQCIHLAILRTIVSNCIKCFGTFSISRYVVQKCFNDFFLIKSQS